VGEFQSSATTAKPREEPPVYRQPLPRQEVRDEPPRHLRQRHFSRTPLDANPLRNSSEVRQATAIVDEPAAHEVGLPEVSAAPDSIKAVGRPFSHPVQRIPVREEPDAYPRRALFQSRLDLQEAAAQGSTANPLRATDDAVPFQTVPLTPRAAEPILPTESPQEPAQASTLEAGNPLRKSASRPSTALSTRIQNPLRTQP